MYIDAEERKKELMDQNEMQDDPRITRMGKFIRKNSIDELSQENEYYTWLTGMWQIKGRGKVFDFEKVVKLDLEYIDNWTLSLDIKILFQTVYVVLFGIGAK